MLLENSKGTLLGLSSLELQGQLAERTDLPIICITGHGGVPMTVQAMKAGAREEICQLHPLHFWARHVGLGHWRVVALAIFEY